MFYAYVQIPIGCIYALTWFQQQVVLEAVTLTLRKKKLGRLDRGSLDWDCDSKIIFASRGYVADLTNKRGKSCMESKKVHTGNN